MVGSSNTLLQGSHILAPDRGFGPEWSGGARSLEITGNNNVIRNSEFEHVWTPATNVFGADNQIINNFFHHIGYNNFNSAAVRLDVSSATTLKHPRSWKRDQDVYDPVHYLALLEKKPGGFDHAKPLEGWRLPACFDELRRLLEADGFGAREFIRVLRLLESCSLSQLTGAVEYALDIGVIDADAIRVIVEHRREEPVALFSLAGRPYLRMVEVEATKVSAYASLLNKCPEGGMS